MSCDNWERGTITIPSAAWAGFRSSLIKAWNDNQTATLNLAKRSFEAATVAGKGKRGKSRQDAMLAAIAKTCGGSINSYGDFDSRISGWGSGYAERNEANVENWETVTRLLGYDRWSRSETFKLHAPKAKDLATFPTSKSCTIRLPDACVTFDNDKKAVTWHVSENNRAVEHANEHWFAKKLFAALGKITWTRGSGGQIVGNDEYNRDSDYAGGGANYVTHDYHMKTAAEKKAEATRSRSYNYGGGYGRRW